MRHLLSTDYREVQVVAGQRTPYPNGPVVFFQQHGFERVGELDQVTLRVGKERLVLMRRRREVR